MHTCLIALALIGMALSLAIVAIHSDVDTTQEIK